MVQICAYKSVHPNSAKLMATKAGRDLGLLNVAELPLYNERIRSECIYLLTGVSSMGFAGNIFGRSYD